MIDIAMTAVLRPEIHTKVFESLKNNLISDHEFRLILNIDPVGNEDISYSHVLENAKKYFSNIKYNFSENPVFLRSLQWVWDNCETDYILQWEDDWTLNDKLYIDDIITFMEKRNVHIFGFHLKKLENKVIYNDIINGRKYRYIYSHQPSPSCPPSILSNYYVKSMVGFMKEDKREIERPRFFVKKNKSARNFIVNITHAKYISPRFEGNGNADLISDIGRKWKIKNNISVKKND